MWTRHPSVDRGRAFYRCNMSDKKAPVPVRRFAVGDLLIEETCIFGDGCPAKVVSVSDDRTFIWISSDAVSEDVVKKYFGAFRCKLEIDCTGSAEVATYGDGSYAEDEDEVYLEYSPPDPNALTWSFNSTSDEEEDFDHATKSQRIE